MPNINQGIIELRPAISKQEITVIVSGIGRSGTSMVAKVLGALGLYMGNVDGATYEDRDFYHALFFHDFCWLDSLTKNRNLSHTRWGIKFPSIQYHMFVPQLTKFYNPHLIVIMRDPIAVAERASKSDPALRDSSLALKNIMEQTTQFGTFVLNAPCPTLLISYEKALSNPKAMVETLARWIDVIPEESIIEKACACILPNNSEYLMLQEQVYKHG